MSSFCCHFAGQHRRRSGNRRVASPTSPTPRGLRSVCGSHRRAPAGQRRAKSRPWPSASPTAPPPLHTHTHTLTHSHSSSSLLSDPGSDPVSSRLVSFILLYSGALSWPAALNGGFCKTGQIKMSNITLFDRRIRNDEMPAPEGAKMVNS